MSNEQDLQLIEKESNELAVKANSFQIATNDDYVSAMNFAKLIKESIKKVEEAFNPVIQQAHKTWKSAIAQKDQYVAPREAALKILDDKGRTFRTEQERIRQAEQAKAQELADKETARLKKLAEKAEARGDATKAEEFAVKAQETAAIVPVIASKVDKVAGITVRKVWKYRITNESIIPREYLKVDDVKLGGIIRATKGTLKIAGVEIYSEDSSL